MQYVYLLINVLSKFSLLHFHINLQMKKLKEVKNFKKRWRETWKMLKTELFI